MSTDPTHPQPPKDDWQFDGRASDGVLRIKMPEVSLTTRLWLEGQEIAEQLRRLASESE